MYTFVVKLHFQSANMYNLGVDKINCIACTSRWQFVPFFSDSVETWGCAFVTLTILRKKIKLCIFEIFKEIVHPKIKSLSSFIHPHVIPNLCEFLSYVEHKIRYFEEFWRTKQLFVPIDFHIRERSML